MNLFFISAYAQTISYTVDSASFTSFTNDGGMTEVQFADVNNDGYVDILTIGDHGSPDIGGLQHGISVSFGNGTGSGWALVQNGNFGYGGIAVGDINNDGFKDVAYSLHHGSPLIQAQLGDSTGTSWTPWGTGLATNGEVKRMKLITQ